MFREFHKDPDTSPLKAYPRHLLSLSIQPLTALAISHGLVKLIETQNRISAPEAHKPLNVSMRKVLGEKRIASYF
jgi:hypothetical protein